MTTTRTDANLLTAREDGMIAANVAAGPVFNAHAEEFLARFASDGREWIAEELIAAAEREGLIADNRAAWGQVVRAAAKRGEIVNTGRCSFKTANGSPKPIWRKA